MKFLKLNIITAFVFLINCQFAIADGYKSSGKKIPKNSDYMVVAEEKNIYIKNVLIKNYIKDDIEYMGENQNYFLAKAYDLNNDGNDEYVIYLLGSYFCGSGGCNLIIINSEGHIMGEAKTSKRPIWISDNMSSQHLDIIYTKSSPSKSILKSLRYDNSKHSYIEGEIKKEIHKNWIKLYNGDLFFEAAYKIK